MEFTEDQIRYMARQEAEDVIKKVLRYGLQGLEPASAKEEEKKVRLPTKEALLKYFPENLRDKLNVSNMSDKWFITKAYDRTEQGKRDWTTVNEAAKALGGIWIGDGKNSRWEVPK